jgi:hypothetical protein
VNVAPGLENVENPCFKALDVPAQRLTLLLFIRETRVSNLDPETGYPDKMFFMVFLNPSRQMPG